MPPKQTPMMRQYLSVKAEHPDAVLLFRLGDFYETFFDDAKIASRVCGIALTSRSKSTDPVPLAGVPYHAADEYIQKLLAAGHKVAVCDQVEDAKYAKGLVKREVTRVITPGTLIDEAPLEGGRNNFLAAVVPNGAVAGLAFVDLSTGEFGLTEIASAGVSDEMARLGASEVLLPESVREDGPAYVGRRPGRDGDEASEPDSDDDAPAVTVRPDWSFDLDSAMEVLKEHFGVSSLAGFGCDEMPLGLRAAGAVLEYLRETQKRPLGHISTLAPRRPEEFLHVDRSTARNLELVEPLRSRARSGTLLGALDRTRTAMGSRRLREWVTRPLASADAVNARLDAVAELLSGAMLRAELRECLGAVQDVERLAAKMTSGRANARDLQALAGSLEAVPTVQEVLATSAAELTRALAAGLEPEAELAVRIRSTLADDPPATVRDGGMIAEGVDAELDRLRSVRSGGKSWIAKLQKREAERTGITSLKVGFNRVFGYYIEVTKPNLDKVPEDYIRKQTLANAERYITPDLKERESEILSADEKILEIEYRVFCELRDAAAEAAPSLVATAGALGRIDCLQSLAEAAAASGWTRPVVDGSVKLVAKDLRHPVIERSLPAGRYVPNDITCDGASEQVLVITGPNMSGKSTYIRSAAVLVVMAQMGSFVPAKSAHVGAADSLFVRAGASDDIAGGASTFMVEMSETARLLNNSTPRSVIILDEVGRGTSTYDGVAVAWATAEYIHDWPPVEGHGPRTLFATHFHELTRLADSCERVANYHVAVREDRGDVTFLHTVRPGGTDRSFGVHVAKLAGVPPAVVARADEILGRLEAMAVEGSVLSAGDLGAQLALFDVGPAPKRARPKAAEGPAGPTDVEGEILRADAERMTPLDALALLDRLRRRLRERGGRAE